MQLVQTYALSIHNSGYGSGGTGNAFWVNGFVCMEWSMTGGHTIQRSGWRKRETDKKEDRKWKGEPENRGGQLQTVVWFWRTEASPILSFLIHAVRWGATIPEGRQKPSAIEEEGKIQKKEKNRKNRKKEKSTGFRSLWNLKEEKENYCADFSMKKMCLFDHWINQKKQSRKLPKPFSGNHQLQRKVLEPSTHTLRHTNPHTPKHVNTEAAETPKIKTVRLAHPQQHMKQFYIADRNQKKNWQDWQRLCQLKSTNNDPKNIQVHMMSYRCTKKITLMSLSGPANASPLQKSNKKKTFMMTRDYQSKLVNTIKKKKHSINIMENRQ